MATVAAKVMVAVVLIPSVAMIIIEPSKETVLAIAVMQCLAMAAVLITDEAKKKK